MSAIAPPSTSGSAAPSSLPPASPAPSPPSSTASSTGVNDKVYYGVVTKNGMWAFSDPNASARDLSKYRLRLGDFVHASLALLVLAALALLDNNTVSCFYPTRLLLLPDIVGAGEDT
ncbi:protein DMP2 [Canna indica]|uniref:Protein DMP2 n=1 Tax=Canna indica TaxID=4628 RepID=A0AAQ3K687_9LILI|nr:protein DMP2 [Canna indica]